MEESVTNKLVYETSVFKDDCMNICKQTIEPVIKRFFETMETHIIDEMKNNIHKKIGACDMYNYDDIVSITNLFDLFDLSKPITEEMINGTDMYIRPYISKFIKNMVKNEKIILKSEKIPTGMFKRAIYITNYGRIIGFYKSSFDSSPSMVSFKTEERFIPIGSGIKIDTLQLNSSIFKDIRGYYEFNFWIPIDYINILRLMVINFKDEYLEYCIFTMLFYMKEVLYTKQNISLYAKEILDENKKLKEEHESIKKEKEELEKLKEDIKIIEDNLHVYDDIELERSKIKKEKELLNCVRIKLRRQREELEDEKKQFEQTKKEHADLLNECKINELDIDEILDE